MADNYLAKIPASIQKIIRDLIDQDFVLTLVGGGPRDFLMDGVFPPDLDFEIRSREGGDGEEWLKFLKEKLEAYCQKNGSVLKELPFGVFRLKFDNKEIEISSPRKESFPDKNSLGHSDLSVEFSSNLDYKEAFSRRDLTLNAIGIEFSKEGEKLVDPYNGQKDLDKKVLRPISEKFYLDPVRFLRCLRFSIKYGLEIDSEIEFSKFNLEKMSLFWFKKEMFASLNPFGFLKLFCSLIEKSKLILPFDAEPLKRASQFQAEYRPSNERELIYVSCLLGLEKSDAEKMEPLFELGKGTGKGIFLFCQSLNEFNPDLDNDLKKLKEKSLKEGIADDLIGQLIELEKFKKHVQLIEDWTDFLKDSLQKNMNLIECVLNQKIDAKKLQEKMKELSLPVEKTSDLKLLLKIHAC